MDNIKKLFVAKRTPAAHVLQLDGFCDGLQALAEAITECLLSGNTDEIAPPKARPEVSFLTDCILSALRRLIAMCRGEGGEGGGGGGGAAAAAARLYFRVLGSR